MNTTQIAILLSLSLATAFFVLNTTIYLIKSDAKTKKLKKQRRDQLSFDDTKESKQDMSGLLNMMEEIFEKHIFKKFEPKNLDDVARLLRMSKMNSVFTPKSYIATKTTLQIGGAILAVVMFKSFGFMGAMYGVMAMVALPLVVKSKANSRKEKLLYQFPDFIRITQGFLSANIPLVQAVKETSIFVGPDWKPILKAFVLDTELKGVNVALDNMRDEMDIFEVREFVSLVKLGFEQGGNVRDSFGAQADRIRKMQQDLMEMKLEKRKSLAVVIQAPVMLTSIMIFALPIVDSFTSGGIM